jgi:hypothetical protein
MRQVVVDAAGAEPVFTSVVSLGESALGVHVCPDPTERAVRAAFLRQVESRPTLGLTPNTAASLGVLAAAVQRAGRSPRPRHNDLEIAAQAIELGTTLWTLNWDDFAGLPGLQLVVLKA